MCYKLFFPSASKVGAKPHSAEQVAASCICGVGVVVAVMSWWHWVTTVPEFESYVKWRGKEW
jgi:uncharacterized membrane protein YidH (DUF202 family)